MGFDPTQRQADIAPLEGERKLVTVMFADVAQSSRLVAGQDPEDADERLLSILQTMIDVVVRYGGTVNQVLGDGIMALFGAPRAQEDHAVRACLAAHAIHEELRDTRSGTPFQGEVRASIRIGLCSGEVVVKRAGSGLDLKYRATGEAVYLAQRLESAAPPGVTLLSGATLALAGDRIHVTPFGSVRLQPDTDSVEALGLTAIDPDRNRPDNGADGSPLFIGRRRTLGALRGALEDADDGRGKAVVISGEAGVGKSRLIQEFLKDLSGRRATVISSHSLPAGLAGPAEPTARILRCLMEGSTGRETMKVGEQVTRWLGTLGLGAEQARWALCDILGLSVKDTEWRSLDPPEQLRLAVEAACRVICEESRRRLLILVFEDFHWADTETRLLAEELAGRIASSRVLIFVTSRSHHGKPWLAWPAVVEHEVRPLSRTHTDRFLGASLGSDPCLLDLKQLLARKTQGNPFFLEECVRALKESGYLSGYPGAYRPTVPLDHVDIPGTIHGVLAGRIDSLSAPERAVLLAASVIGQRFDIGLLRELTQQPRDELLSRLNHLQQAGFVERTRIMPNLEYSFRHALIHEVAYSTLLKRKRRELHAWLVAAVERRAAGQLSGRVELLAHHARAAEMWAKAAAYGRRAGLRAQSKSANREAVDFFLHGLEALQELPRTRRNQQRCIDFRLELVQSLLPLGRHDDALGQLEASESLASQIDDGRRLTKATSGLSLYYWVRGDLERADRRGRKALAMAEQLKDSNSLIQISSRLGGVFLDRGDFQQARRLLSSTIRRIPEEANAGRYGLLVIASVSSRAALARTLGDLGYFQDAITIGDEGIRIAEETGHLFSQIYAYLSVGNALLRKGDFERSLPPLMRGFELCTATRAALLFPLSAASLGYAYVRLGQGPRGLSLLQEAAKAAERQTIKFQFSQELTWLGEASVLSGNGAEAMVHARRALDYAQHRGAIGDEAWALWLLGEIHKKRAGAQHQEAERYLFRARDIAITGLMKPLLAHIDLSLGRLYLRVQSQDKARRRLDAAFARYRELGMHYWMGRAQTELGHDGHTATPSEMVH